MGEKKPVPDIFAIAGKINKWKERYPEDIAVIESMSDDELIDAFSNPLSFGTAGIRGIMGPGVNRINPQVISQVTHGIAAYMCANDMHLAVIGCDGRKDSDRYMFTAQQILTAYDITVYIAHDKLPSPFISFAVRNLKADIGIMITASHNTKEYNGYKVYNSEGCQISEETVSKIQKYIDETDVLNLPDCIGQFGRFISSEFVSEYCKAACMIAKPGLKLARINVLYTPLHGVGGSVMPDIFKTLSDYTEVHFVDAQMFPDSDFPTCPVPNPEIPEAWDYALSCTRGEDVVIATDPDADRAGIAVRHNGKYRILTGNEESALLLNYLCEREENKDNLKGRLFIRSNVSSSLTDRIAGAYGIEVKVVNTGFKNICSNMDEKRFFMGTEEAIGNLLYTHVRDKDAASTIVVMTEMTAYYKNLGKTLIDVLGDIQDKYGIVKNTQVVIKGRPREAVLEYIKGPMFPIKIKDETVYDNRTVFMLADNVKMIVRASGTEPKVKLYLEGYDKDCEAEFIKIRSQLLFFG